MTFDASRATLKGPDMFSRFRTPNNGASLANAGLNPDEQLIVFERAKEKRALVLHQMAYHHVAQGELAGEPYLITF